MRAVFGMRRFVHIAFVVGLWPAHQVAAVRQASLLSAQRLRSPDSVLGAQVPEWAAGNPLAEWFVHNGQQGPQIQKMQHSFAVYNRHLQRFRGLAQVNVLLLGVGLGGDIAMWRKYFGPGLRLIGVDPDPARKQLEQLYPDGSVRIFTGASSDAAFLTSTLAPQLPPSGVQIVLDNGQPKEGQIVSFEHMYWKLDPHGIYMASGCLETQPGSFFAYVQGLADKVNGYYVDPSTQDAMTHSIYAVHFYDQMVAVERRPHPPPVHERRGSWELPYCTPGQENGCLSFHDRASGNSKGDAQNGTSFRKRTCPPNCAPGEGVTDQEGFKAPLRAAGAPPEPWVDNPLATYFWHYTTGPKIWKWQHYFGVYHRHLEKFRGRPEVNVVVVGVQSGGEIGMWRDYFGPGLRFFGADINPACKQLESFYNGNSTQGAAPWVKIFTGNQGDESFLKNGLMQQLPIGKIHAVIDDGSHINLHQILTFNTLFWALDAKEGVFITEDSGTSYTPPESVYREGGTETLVEHMKATANKLNGYYSGTADTVTQNIPAVHFYDAMVVTERKPHTAPVLETTGLAASL